MKETWELQATKPPIGGHTQGSGTHESESRLPAVPGPHLLAPSPQAHRISLSKPAKPPRRVDKLLLNKTKKPHAAKCGIAPSESDPSHHHGNSPPRPHFPTHHLRGNMATARPVGNLACGGPGEGSPQPQKPGWGERQAQSSQRGLHCWIHSGCSLPIRWGLWGWLAPCVVPVLNLDGPSASWAAWGPGDLDISPSRDPPGPRRGRWKSQ